MSKTHYSGFLAVLDGSLSLRRSKPQYFACLRGSTFDRIRIELFKTDDQTRFSQDAHRIFSIQQHSTIKVKKDKNSFVVGNVTFSTQSEGELKQWLSKIREVQPSVNGLSEYSAQMYEVMTDVRDDLGPFNVTLQQSEYLSFYGPCQLEIQPNTADKIYNVAIYDLNQPPRLIIKWQIDHLRGYGSSDSVLKIQTGRRTTTGVGLFTFQTPDSYRIHRSIHYWAQRISSTPSRDTVVSPPTSPLHRKESIELPPRPSKPLGGHPQPSLPPRGDKPSTYQALVNKPPAQMPDTYEPMRQQPLRQNSTSSSLVDNLSSSYQSLNVSDPKPQSTYQTLTTNSRDAKKPANEGTSKDTTPQGQSDAYASLRARDVQQPSYMSVDRSTSSTDTYEGIRGETPMNTAVGYTSIGPRDPQQHQSYMTVNRSNT